MCLWRGRGYAVAEVQHFVKIGLFTVKINDVIKMERGKKCSVWLNRSDWWLQCWLSPFQICTHTLAHNLCSNPLRVQPEVLLITFTHMLSCTCTPLIWLATASHTRTCVLLLLDSWNNAQKDQKDHHFVSFFLAALECFYSVRVQLLCIAPMSSLPCHAMPCQYKSLHYKLNCYCFELFSYDTCPALRKSFMWHGSLL